MVFHAAVHTITQCMCAICGLRPMNCNLTADFQDFASIRTKHEPQQQQKQQQHNNNNNQSIHKFRLYEIEIAVCCSIDIS